MASESTLMLLNRLIVIHSRSLAMYLAYATPSWHRGEEQARRVLEHIVADQEAIVERLGETILEENGTVAYGTFPTEFTAYHDLSFDFLLQKLIQYQRRDIAEIEKCVEGLTHSPRASALAQEALGAAKAHLESLEELNTSHTAAA